MIVSVIIPTFRRDALLERCLDAVIQQTLDSSAYEIIVVDGASQEKTKKLVEQFAAETAQPAIRYLATEGNKGPAAARNLGWRSAASSLIAFTDDDCIPERDWLEKGVAAAGPGIDGVSGRVVVPLGYKPSDHELNVSFQGRAEFVTANCFYRKKVLEEAGGFDERFAKAWREDADLFFTLLKLNYRLVSAPEAVVIHPVRRGHWGISVREQSKSIFNALLYKKHPDLYKKKILNPFLAHYYAIIIFFLVFVMSIYFRMSFVGIPAFIFWISLTLFLCAKRLRRTSRSPGHVLEMLITSFLIPFFDVYWRLHGAVRFKVVFYL
jgi:glycosyltransferase involved in cell wall biosynthesis